MEGPRVEPHLRPARHGAAQAAFAAPRSRTAPGKKLKDYNGALAGNRRRTRRRSYEADCTAAHANERREARDGRNSNDKSEKQAAGRQGTARDGAVFDRHCKNKWRSASAPTVWRQRAPSQRERERGATGDGRISGCPRRGAFAGART